MQVDTEEKGNSRRIRFRLYCITGILSILVFSLSMYWAAMLQFPPGKFPPELGLRISTILFVASAIPLLIGFSKYKTGDAPIQVSRSWSLLILPLALELILSTIGIIQMFVRLLSMS
jgi:hypothetical protein